MLKHRHIALFGVLFTFGIIIGIIFSKTALLRCAVFGIISALLLLKSFSSKAKLKKSVRTALAITLLAIVVGISVSTAYMHFNYGSLPESIASDTKGYVTNVSVGQSGDRRVDICLLSPKSVKGKNARLYTDSSLNIKTADVILFNGELQLADSRSFRAAGIAFSGKISDFSVSNEKVSGFKPSMLRLRAYLSSAIDSYFSDSDRSAALTKALVLGDTSSLDQKTKTAFSRTGASHVLALSGLHFTVIVMSVYALLAAIRVPKRIRCLICICFAFIYCFFIGSTPSATRAAIMCAIAFFNAIVLRAHDPLTSLFLALTIICLFNPYAIFSLSLQLSFTAYFAVILIIFELNPVILRNVKESKIKTVLEKVIFTLLLVLTITMITFPITSQNFSTFSLISPVTNLFITATVSPCLVLMSIASLLAVFPIFAPLATLFSTLIEAFISVIEYIAELDNIAVSYSVPYMSYASIISFIVLFLMLLLPKKARKQIIVKSLFVFHIFIYVTVGLSAVSATEEAVILSNKEQTVITSRDESLMIDFEGNVETELFSKCGHSVLDKLILVNCNSSTSKNMERFFANYRVDAVFITKSGHTLYPSIKDTAERYDVSVTLCDTHTTQKIGDAEFNCFFSANGCKASSSLVYRGYNVLLHNTYSIGVSELNNGNKTILAFNNEVTPIQIYRLIDRFDVTDIIFNFDEFNSAGYKLAEISDINIVDFSDNLFYDITIKNNKARISLYES